jgi:heat shock protein HslJ
VDVPIFLKRESEKDMIFQKNVLKLVGLASIVLFAACAPQEPGVPVTAETETPIPTTPAESTGLPAEAVLNAQQWLATQLSVGTEQVQIIESEQAEWTDSCLGLGRPDESCLQVITPGWRVVLEVNGQRYEVRTDRTGSTIRVASPEGIPGMETGLENTNWNLVSFGSPGAEQPLIEGSTVTLMFAGGQAGGSGGCNSYGGPYQVEGTTITFGEITRTLRACADAGMTEQEDRYLAALASASEYQIEGDRLLITYDNGNGVLIFERALSVGPTPAQATPGG